MDDDKDCDELWDGILIDVAGCWSQIKNKRGKKNPHLIDFRLNIYLELKWPEWEKYGISQLARAREIKESGLYPDMEEDNFRKICRRAGFLK